MKPPSSSTPHVALMEIQDVARSFGGNAVLAGVSCRIAPGQLILLRGDNASGKTTLLNILTGHLQGDRGLIGINARSGMKRIHFQRPFWCFWPERPESFVKAGIARSWQEIRLFPNHSVLDNVAAAAPDQIGEKLLPALFRRKHVGCAEQSNRATSSTLLRDVRIGAVGSRWPGTLSMGQAKRVAIARAVRSGAQVLFLDEPLAGLDQRGIDDVINLIQELIAKQRISVVIVEHLFHIPRLLPLANVVWTLSAGKLIAEEPSAVMEELRHSPNGLAEWFSRLASEGYRYSLSQMPGGARIHLARLDPTAPTMFVAQDLRSLRQGKLSFDDSSKESVSGFSISLKQGDIALLEAPNGWGKTTLLETMAGLLPNATGALSVNDLSITSLHSWERARVGVSLLRSSEAAFPFLKVAEVFKLANTPLPQVLHGFANRPVTELSGGQQQFVNILRVLSNANARVRLLDEPFNMLDHTATQIVKNAIKENTSACTLLAAPGSAQLNGQETTFEKKGEHILTL